MHQLSDTLVDPPLWTELPEYVFEAVVKHVQGDRGASGVFRRVCRAWREAHDRLLTELTPKRSDEVVAVARRLDIFGGLQTLDFTDSPISGYDANAMSSLTGLTSLRLCSCSVTNKRVLALAGLTGLTFLDLYDNRSITDTGVVALSSLTALTDLRLDGNGRVTDEGVMALAEMTALTHLDLSSCVAVTDKAAVAALSLLTGLTSLNLCSCSMTDEGVVALAGLTGLTFLDLASVLPRYTLLRNLNITDTGVVALSALTALTDLRLKGNDRVTDEGVMGLAEMTALTSLDLSGCEAVTDEGLTTLATMPALTQLLIIDCGEVTDEGLTALATMPSLTHLGLDCGSDVSGVGVRRLTSLTRLDLYFAWDPMSVGRGILLSLNALTRLTAIGCSGDSFDELELLTQACEALPLTRLDLVDCHGLTDVGISALGKLTGLRSLSLQACHGVRKEEWWENRNYLYTHDVGIMSSCCIRAVAEACPSLTHLDLSHTEVTDKGLWALSPLKHLADLDLRQCDEVTMEGVWGLTRLNPAISIRL
jgi:Leucine-rich repeat (LRR) protein